MPNLSREHELHRLLERFENQPNGRIFAPLADCYRKLQRLDEAYKVCVDGLMRHPRYSTGFVVLGKIHLDREELEEARTAFETVLSLDPENLIALRELAED
ncbi:MAG TPA: tetratricopeptide repeat protein, partial [Candidatus Krumholzibacteria bacterium]|nr:tetratricopeptide repeat protein [Candidatus Krumholzibacteria bacterium]